VVHDVAIQKLPVRFAVDRAGLVGADGATHAGSFDITYLASLPNFTVMAPSNELELARMVVTAADYNEGPIAFRYPRGNGIGIEFPNEIKPITIGKGKIVKQGEDIVLLCYGTLIKECLEADIALKKLGFNITIVDARFVKPLDEEMILKLIKNHYILITIEEGSIGGFASHVNNFLIQGNHLDSKLKIKNIFLPDIFLQQDTQENQYIKAGLNSHSIVDCVTSMTKIDR
jgi:1-deoxy-D-xylulose-5-phosphate synthase